MGGDGLALLSLGTTRRIRSEDHRVKGLAKIDQVIDGNRSSTGTKDVKKYPARDIPALEDLRMLVEKASVCEEWLTDARNIRLNQELHREGFLA